MTTSEGDIELVAGLDGADPEEEKIVVTRSNSFSRKTGTSKRRSSISEHLAANNKGKKCCFGSCSDDTIQTIKTLVLFTTLILIGGGVFHLLEEPLEKNNVVTRKAAYTATLARVMELLDHNETLFTLLREANPTVAFLEPPVYDERWSFASASMFSFTVVTTIGASFFLVCVVFGAVL